MGVKKLNWLQSAQIIHASRGWRKMCAHQFWWAWPLLFLEILPPFCLPSKQPKFPFKPWIIVHGGQGIGSSQKIHASWREIHANQFWWVWPLRFQRFCLPLKMAKFPFWIVDYSPWGSKNRIGSNIPTSRIWGGVHVHQVWLLTAP